ncbi:MAG TPA: FecR domain-containing protein [Ginsengibacter sp.]
MENNQKLLYLLHQVKRDKATEEEFRELIQFINSDESGEIMEEINNFHENPIWLSQNSKPYNYDYWQAIARKILEVDKTKEEDDIKYIEPVRRVRFGYRWAAAAVILLMICTGVYFLFLNKGSQVNNPKSVIVDHDVKAPTTNRAMITLDNGKIIYLDSTGNGTFATQSNINIVKTGDGKIEYSVASKAPSPGGVGVGGELNTLTNPRGSKVVDITLADGTKVWLNAESSLRYPVAFAGNERKVEITGEAYFEVTHNAAMPFKVQKDSTEITVLGTHFNVNAYDDEKSLKVTLLEGSVKVSVSSPSPKERAWVRLKPGEQAEVSSGIKLIKGIDLDQVMAWKNGRFEFNGSTIQPIMRQLARWYDVEIEYRGPIPTDNFMGGTSRQENISEMLKILEQTKAVHFLIEGKKVIVMK